MYLYIFYTKKIKKKKKQIKSKELRANEIEALGTLEKGIEDLDRANPDLVLTALVEILSRMKT